MRIPAMRSVPGAAIRARTFCPPEREARTACHQRELNKAKAEACCARWRTGCPRSNNAPVTNLATKPPQSRSPIDETQSPSYNRALSDNNLRPSRRFIPKVPASVAGFRLAERLDQVGFSDIVQI